MKQGILFEFEDKIRKATVAETLPFKRIRDEGWDFRATPAGTGVYGIHPYPAMFHFLVVRQLIHEFSKEGDRVLDPFMGSGVVAVECLINNRHFIGYDINPLAVLIAKVRTTLISQKRLLEDLCAIEEKYRKTCPETVEFRNIHYWFSAGVIEQLSRLRTCIFAIEDEEVKNFFKVAFSETVRRVSKTDYNEFKLLRRRNDNSNLNVIKTFKDVSLKNIGLLTDLHKPSENETEMSLETRNVLDTTLDDNSINLVITSPPYGDSRTTVAYGQFSRLSLNWLGLEENVDKTSLGSKPKNIEYSLPSEILYEILEKIKGKDEKRAKEVFSFYKDLFDSIQVISKKVILGGHVCFVVGNRRVKNEELPTDKISADFFENFGFQHQKTIIRAISNKRMPIENAPSNIKGEKDYTMRHEYIVILKKVVP